MANCIEVRCIMKWVNSLSNRKLVCLFGRPYGSNCILQYYKVWLPVASYGKSRNELFTPAIPVRHQLTRVGLRDSVHSREWWYSQRYWKWLKLKPNQLTGWRWTDDWQLLRCLSRSSRGRLVWGEWLRRSAELWEQSIRASVDAALARHAQMSPFLNNMTALGTNVVRNVQMQLWRRKMHRVNPRRGRGDKIRKSKGQNVRLCFKRK